MKKNNLFLFVSLVFHLLLLAFLTDASLHLKEEERFWHHTATNAKFSERGVTTENDPAIIPLGNQQQSYGAANLQNAYSFVFNHLQPQFSEVILYPYAFDVNGVGAANITASSNVIGKSFPQGAVLTFDSVNSALPDKNSQLAAFFEYLKLSTTIDLDSTKAVYDSNIAVLNVLNQGVDLITFEVPKLCTALHLYLNKYVDCLDYATFQANLANANHEKTSVVVLSPTDIANGALVSGTGIPNFGLLILPDYNGLFAATLNAQLSTGAFQKIAAFATAGGNVFASGKGAVLLESAGLLASGFFDQSTILTTNDNNNVGTQGCDPNTNDFDLRTLCFSLLQNVNTGLYESGLIGPFAVSTSVTDPNYNVLIQVNPAQNPGLLFTSTTTGLSSSVTTVQPLVLRRQLSKSKIIIHLGSTTFNSKYYPWLFNTLFLVNSKPIFTDWTMTPSIIPAFESVIASASLDLTNLFASSLTNFVLTIWKQQGTAFTSYPSSCTLQTPSTNVPSISNIDTTSALVCDSGSTLVGQSKLSLTINVQILDTSITQSKYNVWLLYPTIAYNFGSYSEYLEPGAITVNAFFAALLRTDYNPDPSSFYPLAGAGVYIDNVLTLENKAETEATEVVHYAIVPIITPLFDISDQAAITRLLEFDYHYYEQSTNLVQNYYYPFVQVPGPLSAQMYDYLDYQVIGSRDATLAVDWDTPVKIYKTNRGSPFPGSYAPNVDVNSIGNVDWQTNIENSQQITQQVFFGNSDQYYEHATQKLMPYVDTTKLNGSLAYYQNNIPSQTANPSNMQVAKKKWVFVRQDLYFYTNPVPGGIQYPLPEGLTDRNAVLTIDRYPASPCPTSNIAVPGCFSGAGNASCPKGIKENEYTNALTCTGRPVINYPSLSAASGGQIEQIHYLVPIVDPTITSYSDVDVFVSGAYGAYSELKFIQAHNAKFTLDPSTTRQGGYIQILLPATVSFSVSNPLSNYYIQYSSDQVAITNHEVNVVAGVTEIKSYFKRGNAPNEAFGKLSQMEVNLEALSAPTSFSATINIYSLTYDLSSPATNYEAYTLVNTTTGSFQQLNFLSLPAVKMAFSVKRGANNDSFVYPYENFEPYVRYGVYLQELLNHKTVYNSVEVHPIRDPGSVTANGGASVCTHVGISSIPFREYVTTGVRQLIPAAPETGRVEWKDIWGRKWAQPVRSLFVDEAPIPPPLRNFIMTTTFELLDPITGAQLTNWNSRDSVDIRVQVKLLNNYPKYFEITACKNDSVLEQSDLGVKRRIFSTDVVFPYPQPYSQDNAYVDFGFYAQYGGCFDVSGAILSGQALGPADFNYIEQAQLCSQSSYAASGEACQGLGVTDKKISRRPDNSTYQWNYSPRVNTFYPSGYIQDNMWDLTHYDYDDNAFDKAYKYHMDNNLPNIDLGIIKPHNLIAFPLFKGAGYQMTYSKTYQTKKYSNKPSGWWADNLQNKDDTLLVGQSSSSSISVNQPDLVNGWTEINSLNPSTKAATAKKNIYTCLFNRWRASYHIAGDINTYPENAYVNNVVPVIPDLDSNDVRLTNYDCQNEFYTPENISQVDSLLTTDSARDWLYFASNLRGGAKESFNVVYKLDPIANGGQPVLYEDLQTSVVDGGRFVYWNPANGPNSFLVVDNPTSNIQSVRCDVTAEARGQPAQTTTTNSETYMLIHVQDKPEINREYTLTTYKNNNGFGDSSISVFVGGGVGGTTSVVNPGETTVAEIAFYNNAGFDWNLLATAISSTELGSYAISANDLLSGIKHSILIPTKYNFMTVSCAESAEFFSYLDISPSVSQVGKAPQFFDFENINVATIRDGFKGLYYYDITVKSTLPTKFMGRVWHLQVTLDPTQFDHLPGPNDPIGGGYHSYTLSIPDIVIAIPYPNSAPSNLAGKVFYTSGYSSTVDVHHNLASGFSVAGAKIISLAQGSQILSGAITDLASVYDSSSQVLAPITTGSDVYYQLLPQVASSFPIQLPDVGGYHTPDQAELYILAKIVAPGISYGTHVVSNVLDVVFNDWQGLLRKEPSTFTYTVFAVGPSVSGSFTGQLVTPSGLTPLANQALGPNQQATMLLTASVVNSGSDFAYNLNLQFVFGPGVVPDVTLLPPIVSSYTLELVNGVYVLTLVTSTALSPSDPLTFPIYVDFTTPSTGGSFVVVQSTKAFFTLTPTPGNAVSQDISSSFSVVVQSTPVVQLDLQLQGTITNNNVGSLTAQSSTNLPSDITYIWLRKLQVDATRWEQFSATTQNAITTPLNCDQYNKFAVFISQSSQPSIALAEADPVQLPLPCGSQSASPALSPVVTHKQSNKVKKHKNGDNEDCTVEHIELGSSNDVKGTKKSDRFIVHKDDNSDERIVIERFETSGKCPDELVIKDFKFKNFEDIDIKDTSKGALVTLPNGQKILIKGVKKSDLKDLVLFLSPATPLLPSLFLLFLALISSLLLALFF